MNKSRALSLLTALLMAMQPLLVLAAGPPQTVPATTGAPTPAPNWYDVELIVFSYTDPSAGSLETWPLNPGTPAWGSAIPLNPTGSGLPYSQLAPSSYRLNADWQKLAHSSDYQPLLHVAWAQPAIDRASALFVQIGTPPLTAPAASTSTAPFTASVPIVPSSQTQGSTQVPLYGTARLSTTGPYLHFDLDLLYRGTPAKVTIPETAQSAASGVPATPYQWYRLMQSRRIDAGRLNYFDQPLFGVLLLVTPIKHP